MDICSLTIRQAKEALDRKEFSAIELVEACLENSTKYDGILKALLTVDVDGARQEASAADRLRAQGVSKPLLGIPFVLKDLYTTKGLRTTAGSKIIDNYTPPFDATVVVRLKNAGAVILGKANQDAWGHGSSGENSDYFPTKNPYDTSRVPGGSSSGSAVAVASGMCLAATGTDTGSSVRLPASFCNLVGIKPTYGRVSRYGIIAMASSFDTIGHMTKTIWDNALVYEITAGKDPLDASSVDRSVPRYTQALGKAISGVKIGLPKEYFSSKGIDSSVFTATKDAIKELEALGAMFVEVSLPHTDVAMACYYILVPAEISSNLARFDGIRYGYGREVLGEEAKRRITMGTHALSSGYYDAYYKRAAKVRTLIKNDFDEAFQHVDVILIPASPATPFKIGEKTQDPLAMYLSDIFMCPVNIAGAPALSVPCGFVDGLPIGFQLIGPQFEEERLYQVGYAYEQEAPWYKTKPDLKKVIRTI
ncbi:Asp-tRNA(Asn)/Glu-tRNA(Gln) amidotransferase subunit GatA [Patescibacteria group bacterium]|nr:Asp-tRNA(Asn)/Glu-tRNA(Gln) amidotransferase subunit GatA [Patescibacteria group bacterium]